MREVLSLSSDILVLNTTINNVPDLRIFNDSLNQFDAFLKKNLYLNETMADIIAANYSINHLPSLSVLRVFLY